MTSHLVQSETPRDVQTLTSGGNPSFVIGWVEKKLEKVKASIRYESGGYEHWGYSHGPKLRLPTSRSGGANLELLRIELST